jgi:murein DD-endopeptidase MepM/ murein hydrolase activator NlpD
MDDSVQCVEAIIGKRLFLTAVAKAGITANEAVRLIRAFDGVHRFDRTHPKDSFSFARDRSTHRLLAFEYETVRGDIFQAREVESQLVGKKLDLEIEKRPVSFGMVVGSELKDALTAVSVEHDMLRRLDEALDGHVSLSDIHAGGRLRIVATETRIEGSFARYENVLAVEYQSPRAKVPRLRVYAFGEGKDAAHYNEKGERPFHGGYRFPIALARVTSRFNPRRMHPVLHRVMPHNGVDFAGVTGTPVYAVAAGTLRFAGDSGPCGNMVQIAHTEGLTSAYCHLSKIAAARVNAKVEPGQLLGYVGQTGRVTGPHLHFAMKRNGQFIDPLALKMGGTRALPASQREAFAARRRELDGQLDAIVVASAAALESDSDAGDSEFLDENQDDLADGLGVK